MWGAIFVQDSVCKPAPWIHICLWTRADSTTVIESVPAYSCPFSASPEGWSSGTADKVRSSMKLLSHLFKAWCNNKIPVWHPFHLILEIVNWDCFFCCSAIAAIEQQLSGEGRKIDCIFYCFTSCLISICLNRHLQRCGTKAVHIDVNLGCQLALLPPVGSVLALMWLCGKLALGTDPAT